VGSINIVVHDMMRESVWSISHSDYSTIPLPMFAFELRICTLDSQFASQVIQFQGTSVPGGNCILLMNVTVLDRNQAE
jgi:hypothetical protein